MDNCRHISKLTPATDHSVLNPQNWACQVCGTTESVWVGKIMFNSFWFGLINVKLENSI
jgi:hypothetical protein